MSFQTFTLELQTTLQCSLRCPYCYIDFKDEYLTKEQFDKSLPDILDLMERSKTKDLNLSFFGGEPLLNFEVIKHVTKIMKRLPMKVSLVIISNLTEITQEMVDWVKAEGVGISWSFDGMSSNETRPLAQRYVTKKSDGSKYSNTLELYRDKKDLISQVSSGCKFMVWPGNSGDMAKNLDFFVEMGIQSPDYSLVRDDVWTEKDIRNFRIDLRELGDKYIDYMEKGVYLSVGFFTLCILDNILGLTMNKRPFGCFAGIHGASMDTNGKFYPCARFKAKDVMEIDQDYNFQYFQEEFNPQNFDKCKSCDLYTVCNAGCTFSQIRNDNKPLDSICELFHIIQEETQRVTHILRDNKTFHALIDNALKNMG